MYNLPPAHQLLIFIWLALGCGAFLVALIAAVVAAAVDIHRERHALQRHD